MKPDLIDAITVFALGLIGWGLWWIYAPLGPLAVGIVVLLLALRRAMIAAMAEAEKRKKEAEKWES